MIDNRGSETAAPVSLARHRDLRSDPGTSFAGPNVRESPGNPRLFFSPAYFLQDQLASYFASPYV